jgi:hypothetical protein
MDNSLVLDDFSINISIGDFPATFKENTGAYGLPKLGYQLDQLTSFGHELSIIF